MNLLKETIRALEEYGKSEQDVVWCGSKDYWFEWQQFKKLADTEYDNGYGAPQVAEDLLIVGQDFYLERHEYDGSEWWEYKRAPQKPTERLDVVALTIEQATENDFNVSCGWETLASINGK